MINRPTAVAPRLHGVEPDIVVENLTHATFQGEHAQLDAAIQHLLAEIENGPARGSESTGLPGQVVPVPADALAGRRRGSGA